ncbi:MAG: ATP-binding response regulator, partial [Myxococcaceae bacterium]
MNEEQHTAAGDRAQLSCRPMRSMFSAFRQGYGEEKLRETIARLELPSNMGLASLEDENHWIPLEVAQRILVALTEASGDPSFPRQAGLQLASRDGLGVGFHFLKAFGTPKLCYRKVLEISPVYNRVGKFTLNRLGRNRLNFSYKSAVPETGRNFCEFRMGQFESLPTIWGLPPARAKELTCQNRGDAQCTYEFEWVSRRFPFMTVLCSLLGALLVLVMGPGSGVVWSKQSLVAIGALCGASIGALFGGIFLVRQRDVLLSEQNRDLLRSVQSLHRLNDTLEAKVDERTRALQETGKQLEEALLTQVKLDQTKTHFFTNLNHDLRSPLTVVMGGLSSILSDQSFGKGTRQRHFLELALRSAARLEAMINDMLELSRIDAGMGKLELSRVDLREQIRNLVQVSEPYGHGLKLELRAEVPERPLYLDVDADKLERVLMNLLFNACKFTRPGTVVMVSAKEEDDGVVMSVRDEGTGIPKDDCARIFDRFYRTGTDESRRAKGTGLGLAVVKEFVELHRGRVWVESELGVGSSFFVWIPKGLAADVGPTRMIRAERTVGTGELLVPRTTAEIRLPAEGAPEILVVEDDEDVRRYLSAELSRAHVLVEATGGEEALKLVSSKAPQLVLTDIMLPGMSGLELCRRLRENPHTAHLPIVLFSARGDVQTRL